ncbi:MAG: hypothetical protein QM280_01345 [Bacteroidota bacterium]|nr:hypothetical protein [Bacteroidota bacterium]
MKTAETNIAPTDLTLNEANIQNNSESTSSQADFITEITAEIETAGTQIPPELQAVILDYTKDVKAPETVLQIGENPTFTRGNISCISGKAKSRKSFLIALFVGDLIKESCKVLLIDTEQGTYHITKSAQRILQLADISLFEKSNNLIVLTLREKDTKARRELTEQAIKYYTPDIVFIDGIRDLIYSINDEHEATEIINLLMRLSSEQNTHICSVLHENKGDNNTRGHIGTELMNKSETIISVTKDGDLSKVEPKYCRNIDFETFYFRINENSLPEKATPEAMPTEKEKKIKLYQNAFADKKQLAFNELVMYVMNHCFNNKGQCISENTAKQRVKRAANDDKIIFKNGSNLYELSQSFTPPEKEYQNYYDTEKYDEELPF